jgi:hypothetical protein
MSGNLRLGHAAEFFCPVGNVTCLIASINEANGLPGEHAIILEPGAISFSKYKMQVAPALPIITSYIRIQPSEEESSTVITRDPSAGVFNFFNVALRGRLHLSGVNLQRGSGRFGQAILNAGHTTVENSIVSESTGEEGAIYNSGTLEVLNSLITDNSGGHDAGGIVNDGGSVLLENSTIAHNSAIGTRGTASFGGNLVIKNSSIVLNLGNCCEIGGGIANIGGSVEIINSIIAKNQAGNGGGGGIWNKGLLTITNSTIRKISFFLALSLKAGAFITVVARCVYKTRLLQEILSIHHDSGSVQTAMSQWRVLETT